MSSKNEVLLGYTIHQNLKWAKHVLHGNIILIKSLLIQLKALNLMSSVAPFRTWKMVEDGIFEHCFRLISFLLSFPPYSSEDFFDFFR